MASRNPNKKYQLQFGLTIMTNIRGVEYEDDGIAIYYSGLVHLKKGLCSDGCSPTWPVKHLGIVGPWNGPIDRKTNLPITARAFFLHDALLETRKFSGMKARYIHKAFCVEMMKTNFIFKRLYCFLATRFGPQD